MTKFLMMGRAATADSRSGQGDSAPVLKQRLAELEARFRELEARLGGKNGATAPAAAAAAPAPAPAPQAASAKEEELSPEILMVISAAIAAFLGKKARIRRVRRATPGMNPWAQQGRVNIQASHNVQWSR